MRKPISPKVHGILDYTTSATVAALPRFIDMPPRASRFFEGLGAGYASLSSVTDYPMGAKRLLPFKAHGMADVAVGVALPVVPWLLGFQEHRAARNLCFGLAAFTGIVVALTDWNGRTRPRQRRRR